TEPHAAGEELPHDQQRPALAQDLGRLGHRAELPVGLHRVTVPLARFHFTFCSEVRRSQLQDQASPTDQGWTMPGKAAISLTTGLEDPEKVTVAFLVAVGAAESDRPTTMFLTKEA